MIWPSLKLWIINNAYVNRDTGSQTCSGYTSDLWCFQVLNSDLQCNCQALAYKRVVENFRNTTVDQRLCYKRETVRVMVQFSSWMIIISLCFKLFIQPKTTTTRTWPINDHTVFSKFNASGRRLIQTRSCGPSVCPIKSAVSLLVIWITYRKIPKISPGTYIFQRPFLRGLFLEGLIYGGKVAFQNRLG